MRTFTRLFRIPKIKILSLLVLVGILIVGSIPALGGGVPRQNQSQQRYLEVTEISGTVTYENEGLKQQARAAKIGDRISRPGEGIRTGSGAGATLTADNGIGTAQLSENTDVRVKNLSRSRNGATNTQLAMNRGKLRARVRQFTNPGSNFSIQTPTGIAGVRGTEFVVEVLPNGETRVSTREGAVAVSGQNQTREVTGGYSSVISPGNPPTPVSSIVGPFRISLQVLPAPDIGKVQVSGQVNPINSVLIDDRKIDLSPTGEFESVVPLEANGRLKLTVRNPFDEDQVFELIVP